MIKSKSIFFLFLLVLVLQSPLSWADVTLTDQEYQELQRLLTESETEMQKSKTDLTEAQNELTLLKQELQTLKSIMKTQSQLLDELEKSLNRQMKERITVELGTFYADRFGAYAGIGIHF